MAKSIADQRKSKHLQNYIKIAFRILRQYMKNVYLVRNALICLIERTGSRFGKPQGDIPKQPYKNWQTDRGDGFASAAEFVL